MTSMASDLAAILSSPIIRIYAAEENTFFVHENVLTSQSQPFHGALTGEWTESTDRAIDLQEWDLATVVRMLEFLYRGTYKSPDTTQLAPDGEALLAHAKVYHLAHYKAIDPLQALALQNTDRILGKIDPVNSPVALEPLVQFVRYVYANTDHLDHHEEPLRTLVSNFVARNFQALRSAPSIAQLLSEGGDIVMDVMMAVSRGPSRSRPSPPSSSSYPPRYVKRLELVSSSRQSDKPHDRVRELNGSSSDVNLSCGDNHMFKWIYPIHTTVANDACVGFRFGERNELGNHLMIEGHRFILHDHDRRVSAKITAVALLLQHEEVLDISCIPPEHGTFNGMTENINRGRPGGYLYIVWKSIIVG